MRRLDAVGFLSALVPGLGWSEDQEMPFLTAGALTTELVSDPQTGPWQDIQDGLILLALGADDDSAGRALAARLAQKQSSARLGSASP